MRPRPDEVGGWTVGPRSRGGRAAWLERLRPAREYGLTAGTLGSTSAQTVMVAIFPIVLAQYAPSAFMLGLAIGGEGALALLVPYWIGLLSDRLPPSLVRQYGRRTFFLLVSAPVMALSIAAVPFLSGYWRLAGFAFVFFAALHAYLTPLWALMIDEVPASRWGRAQGVRGILHSGGLAFGLVAGGLLFSLWRPLPFLLSATLVLATTALTWAASRTLANDRDPTVHARRGRWIERKPRASARWFLLGNALWTGGVDGLRPYIFLFAMTVLGITVGVASLVLVLLVLSLGVGSAALGWLGDRLDRGRLLLIGTVIAGVAMVPGIFVRGLWGAVPLLVVAGAGAAAVMTLPFPVYAGLVGEASMGRRTGMYVMSVGAGRMVAPMVVGAAIDFGANWFPRYDGYPLMWPVAGAFMLAGALALKRALDEERQGRRLRAGSE